MLVDFPVQKNLQDYQNAIDEMVTVLSGFEGIHSIFQVGGLSSPGISDIDFFVVFEDDVSCNRQALSEISAESRYLFTHGLFGTSKRYASQTEQYTFFGNYRKLWGADFDMKAEEVQPSKALQLQIALEYLAKMYITMNLEGAYRLVGVRNFLLLGKAIMYDLNLLHIKEGELFEVCEEVLTLRDDWFNHQPSNASVEGLIRRFKESLEAFNQKLFDEYTLYLPEYFSGQIARNIFIEKGATAYTRKGFLPAPALGAKLIGPKFKKGLNRLNTFTFKLPYKTDEMPKEVLDRFNTLKEAADYNRAYLPNFSVTGYPLNIF